MKYAYFTAPAWQAGGFLQRVLRAPQASAALACTLIILGAFGALGLSLASIEPANAGGTCRPAQYSLPATTSLASAASGLSVQDDGVTHYGVGGDSVPAIRSALNSCAPGFTGASAHGEFLAYTSYTLNWDYRIEHLADGTCRATTVKVGLHLSQLQPELINARTVSPSIQKKWSAFEAGLVAHENGHKAIDIAKAQALVTTLGGMKGSCARITAMATSATNAVLNTIVTANADHDSSTDYGRDQGASW